MNSNISTWIAVFDSRIKGTFKAGFNCLKDFIRDITLLNFINKEITTALLALFNSNGKAGSIFFSGKNAAKVFTGSSSATLLGEIIEEARDKR